MINTEEPITPLILPCAICGKPGKDFYYTEKDGKPYKEYLCKEHKKKLDEFIAMKSR